MPGTGDSDAPPPVPSAPLPPVDLPAAPGEQSPPPRSRPVQWSPYLDRTLKSRDKNAEQHLIDGEPSPANILRVNRDAAVAEMEERIRLLIEEELKTLSFAEKGELAAFWIEIRDVDEVCGEDPDDVDRALCLESSARRVAVCRAFKEHPCGKRPVGDKIGKCYGVPGCAHGRGEELWISIVRRVIDKLHP